MEVEDSTKSMSKRHAQFSVRGDGQAILHDLNSTNGTYIIRDNGELMRLPEDDDYILPYSPMRVQFGDVPADFERVDASESEQSAPVANLFDYSTPMVTHQEPDAADMSVDQILDLRAGEPTTMFQSQRPKSRNKPVLNGGANEAAAQPVQLVQPVQPAQTAQPVQPVQPTPSAQPIQQPWQQQPAQFADQPVRQERVDQPVTQPMLDRQPWQAEQTESAEQSADADVMPTPQPSMQPVQRLAQSAEESSEQARLMFPSDDEEPGQPRNLFAGVGGNEHTADAQEPRESGVSEQEQTVEPDAVEPVNGRQSQQATVQAEPLFAQPEANDAQAAGPAADQAFMRPQPQQEAEPEPETAVFREARSVVFTPLSQNAGTPQNGGYQPSANYAEPAGGFTPAFEPGSVFDKVSRGEFNKPPEPVIEVDGLTSEDARRTPDMTKQFEMARHAELLPFLAMNPSLYDDLYAWLAAQGNRDIDEALANNPGYQDYRKAVGK